MEVEQIIYLIPEGQRRQARQLPEADYRIPLDRLGYLESGNLQTGVQLFIQEVQAADWLTPEKISKDEAFPLSLMEVLHQMVSLEGDLRIPRIPGRGEVSVWSRVWQWRLNLFGLYNQPIGKPFNEVDMQALRAFRQLMRIRGPHLFAIHLSGDLDEVVRRVMKKMNLEERLVAFPFQGKLPPEDILEELAEEEGEEEQANIAKEDERLDAKLNQIEQAVWKDERALWIKLEEKIDGRRRRAHRIEATMQQILNEQNLLFQQSLQEEQRLLEQRKELKLVMEERLVELQAIQQKGLAAETPPSDSVFSKEEAMLKQSQLQGELQVLKKQDQSLQRQLAVLRHERAQQQGRRQLQLQTFQSQLLRIREKSNGLRFRFKAQLKRSLTKKAFRNIRQQVFRARDKKVLEAMHQEAENQFLLRLIQLQQWTSGYYLGPIDGIFDPKTFNALMQLVDDIPSIKLKYVLTKLGDSSGYWVVNMHYLISQWLAHQKGQDDWTPEMLLQRYRSAFTHSEPSVQSELLQKAHQQSKKTPHLYFGVKSLCRSIGLVFQKVIGFIRWGIARVFSLLQHFARLLMRFIQQGLYWLLPGIDYLIKMAPGGTITQTFLREVVHRLLPEGSDHSPVAAGLRRPSIPSILIAVKVVRVSIQLITGSLTWPVLALRIATYTRLLLRKWLDGKRADLRAWVLEGG